MGLEVEHPCGEELGLAEGSEGLPAFAAVEGEGEGMGDVELDAVCLWDVTSG